MSYDNHFRNTFIREIHFRLFEECVPRLEKCLDQLTEVEVWQRPNAHSNSVGNLVLHLTGNVRQWVLSGLGDAKDERQRQTEFDEKGPVPKAQLLADLKKVMQEVESLLESLPPHTLIEDRQVQGFTFSGMGILIHVTEHFSYHVGQMTYYIKAIKDMDMGYYEGVDLEVR